MYLRLEQFCDPLLPWSAFQEGIPSCTDSFKILALSDMHFGENAWDTWGPLQDARTVTLVSRLLQEEEPDLVVLLGDVLTGNNLLSRNATLYWDIMIKPIMDAGVPWVTTLGNHDDMPFVWPAEWFDEAGLPLVKAEDLWTNPSNSVSGIGGGDRLAPQQRRGYRHDCLPDRTYDERGGQLLPRDLWHLGCSKTKQVRGALSKLQTPELLQHDQSLGSLSSRGPATLWPSVTNGNLTIYGSSECDETRALLYFTDSGGGTHPEVVSSAQVAWLNATMHELNPDQDALELLFQHIPIAEFGQVQPPTGGAVEAPCHGTMAYQFPGGLTDASGHNLGELLQSRRSMVAMFSGHDHGNDWCCPLPAAANSFPTWMCHTHHSGFGGYGSLEGFPAWDKGARVIRIVDEADRTRITTWVTLVRAEAVTRSEERELGEFAHRAARRGVSNHDKVTMAAGVLQVLLLALLTCLL